MDTNHKKFMAEAIKLSRKSVASGGGPFGAVVVKNNKIIGRGVNRVTVNNDPTAHGEVMAIRDACRELNSFELKGCILYTSAEPCPMCLGAIYWARIEKIYFGNTRKDIAKIGFDDDLIYKELEIRNSKRKIPLQRIMGKQASAAFRDWSQKNDKIRY